MVTGYVPWLAEERIEENEPRGDVDVGFWFSDETDHNSFEENDTIVVKSSLYAVDPEPDTTYVRVEGLGTYLWADIMDSEEHAIISMKTMNQSLPFSLNGRTITVHTDDNVVLDRITFSDDETDTSAETATATDTDDGNSG